MRHHDARVFDVVVSDCLYCVSLIHFCCFRRMQIIGGGRSPVLASLAWGLTGFGNSCVAIVFLIAMPGAIILHTSCGRRRVDSSWAVFTFLNKSCGRKRLLTCVQCHLPTYTESAWGCSRQCIFLSYCIHCFGAGGVIQDEQIFTIVEVVAAKVYKFYNLCGHGRLLSVPKFLTTSSCWRRSPTAI